jgi:hypothetical protein
LSAHLDRGRRARRGQRVYRLSPDVWALLVVLVAIVVAIVGVAWWVAR